ncbi:MAG: CDP-diacylglycerol--glycerol-3-phosphate 3-phosphatidyltransferase [Nitriliruptoraceae bacterium]
MSIPNALTFLRVLLVPVILALLAQGPTGVTRWWAFGVFLFAAATDTIDGWVARKLDGVTAWGQLADPIADKLLIIGSLASLALVGELPWWAVAVIIARELAVTGVRLALIRRHDVVMPASAWGKAKTFSQVVAVALFLPPGMPDGIANSALTIAIFLTVWSGIDYAFRAVALAKSQSA